MLQLRDEKNERIIIGSFGVLVVQAFNICGPQLSSLR